MVVVAVVDDLGFGGQMLEEPSEVLGRDEAVAVAGEKQHVGVGQVVGQSFDWVILGWPVEALEGGKSACPHQLRPVNHVCYSCPADIIAPYHRQSGVINVYIVIKSANELEKDPS